MSSPAEQIKERLDLVELVGSYIKLEKSGANYRANCPFHSEKTPSFYVSPARQIWHCFGCNAGGDHFKFVMDMDGVEFIEALRILAERAGIEIKREDPKLRSERTRLLSLMDEATNFYENNLMVRKDVGEYLKARGMEGQTAKKFRLGYAQSSWDSLAKHLASKGYKNDEMEKAGLVLKSDKAGGGYYDRFRARVMFPIADSSGRIVGFSGRIYEEDAKGQKDADAKYINTPQTILYDKSKVLYGFHEAKNDIRKQNSCVLVEGQMDLIMSHQAGVKNAVALSGTALTPHQLNFVKRLADNVITCLDMDEAGLKATERSIELALNSGFEVRAMPLPSGKDPADLIKENKEKWISLVLEAEPIISFYLNVLKEQNSDARQLKSEVEKKVLPYVIKVASEIERAHWVGEIAKTLGIREEPVWKEIEKIKLPKDSEPQEVREGMRKTRRDLLEERLIGIALWKREETKNILVDCKPEWFSQARSFLFQKAVSADANLLEEHYPKKLALEAELLYSGMGNFDEETQTLSKELYKEHIRAKLALLAEDIREQEEKENQEELKKKLEEFKDLSSQLNR